MSARDHGREAGSVSPVEPLDLPAWRRVTVPGHGPGLALDVGGEPLWFASPDVELTPGPESVACLLAYPCLLDGRPLKFSTDLPGAAFLENLRGATGLMASWWGHRPLDLLLPEAVPAERLPGTGSGQTALFFSGGVDAFYSLVRNPGVGLLVFLKGFDVRLDRPDVAEAMTRAFRRIAANRGMQLVTVATNLRDHGILGKLRWPRYHGAPLGAAAHILRACASRFIISSSYPLDNLMPWGSHPDLDWRWGDDQVSIIHFGSDCRRAEKLVAMAGEPLVHQELRVCYPPSVVEGNCGHCEKCVRTRLTYRLMLPGIACPGLPDALPLPVALDRLAPIWAATLLEDYRQLLACTRVDDDVTRALRALISRSEEQGRARRPGQ